jgi:adenosylhomocysteinase
MAIASRVGDFFCTLTGDMHVIRKEHFLRMKDGAIVANSGHFNVELDMEGLEDVCREKREIRPFVHEYLLGSGKKVYVLAEGRLVNLAAAEGHPAAVMDMSFANQALCVEFLAGSAGSLQPGVYPVPEEIDRLIARLKLEAMGVKIDRLTEEQRKYLKSWEHGT